MCICIHSFIFISIYTHFWGTHHCPNQKQGGKHVINAIRELHRECAGGGQQTPFEMGTAITGVMRPSRGPRQKKSGKHFLRAPWLCLSNWPQGKKGSGSSSDEATAGLRLSRRPISWEPQKAV